MLYITFLTYYLLLDYIQKWYPLVLCVLFFYTKICSLFIFVSIFYVPAQIRGISSKSFVPRHSTISHCYIYVSIRHYSPLERSPETELWCHRYTNLFLWLNHIIYATEAVNQYYIDSDIRYFFIKIFFLM